MRSVEEREAYARALRNRPDSEVLKFYMDAVTASDEEMMALCLAELRRRRLVN